MKHHNNFQDYLNEQNSKISDEEREMRKRSLEEDGCCSDFYEHPRTVEESSDYPYPDGFDDEDFEDEE